MSAHCVNTAFHDVSLVAFAAAEFSKLFSGREQRRGVKVWKLADASGSDSVPETSDNFHTLTRLSARKHFTEHFMSTTEHEAPHYVIFYKFSHVRIFSYVTCSLTYPQTCSADVSSQVSNPYICKRSQVESSLTRRANAHFFLRVKLLTTFKCENSSLQNSARLFAYNGHTLGVICIAGWDASLSEFKFVHFCSGSHNKRSSDLAS